MAFEYETTVFRPKRIHNIRDFVYEVKAEGISVGDLALFLNTLTDEAFFWTEGKYLHSTGEVDPSELLPEELKGQVKELKRVKEGYLPHSMLPTYTVFALFVADFNKTLSPNFKSNPVFRKLRRRTKEGWNLSLWMKFLHEFSLGYKHEEDGIEYQLWRWFSVGTTGEYVVLSFNGGVEINKTLKEVLKNFDEETLKRNFAFRVKGTYRVGRLKNLKGETAILNFEGIFESEVPTDRLFPIYIPEGLDWREKDKTGLLKKLRLTPKTVCKYSDTLLEVINKLLEPYMVKLEKDFPRVEEVKASTHVVVDKPVEYTAVVDYIFDERKVYNAPFEGLKINLVDLCLKSEKNKKLLKDSKKDFVENLEGFLKDINVKPQFGEMVFPKKVKEWNLEVWEDLEGFIKENFETLKGANFNIILIPYGEKLTQNIYSLPVWNKLKETLKGTKFLLLTDRDIKIFYKTQKVETKRRILFGILKELFKTNGGSLYILADPLPLGNVAVETERGYELYNLFGELLEIRENAPSGEDFFVVKAGGSANDGEITLSRRVAPPLLKREIESGICSNVGLGASLPLDGKNILSVLRKGDFDYSSSEWVNYKVEASPEEVVKTLLDLSKVTELPFLL